MNGDGFGTVEDDCHILVEMWEVVNMLRIELFLIEKEKRQEGVKKGQIHQGGETVPPILNNLSPGLIAVVTEVDEVWGSQCNSEL